MNEEQKIQELLKPRYIVEIRYPGCPFKKGDILVQSRATNFFGCSDKGAVLTGRLPEAEIKECPEIFRKLEWHEHRDASEMPEFVKYAENGMVAKVDHFDLETTSAWFMYLEGGIHPYCPGGSSLQNTHWLPATAAEYHAYINQPA